MLSAITSCSKESTRNIEKQSTKNISSSLGIFAVPSSLGQPLYEEEIQVEGHSWYINQNYDHRDATFEEILHLVHDYGIGVDGPNSLPGAATEYQAKIRASQQNALTSKLWAIGFGDTIDEWARENSLTQEYLASVIDSYYGLWGAWTESSTHGMWGGYIAKTREEIVTEDPMGQDLLDGKFFHPYLTYNARIDANFTGTFSLQFDASLPYTHHSQYLRNVTLLENKNTNVRVNKFDNDITGNEGTNIVIFNGKYHKYGIIRASGLITVKDNTANRDGVNTVRNVEKLQFLDKTITL